MDAEQLLKDHEAEAFKKIACAMGKDDFIRKDFLGIWCAPETFNPLTNAEQWLECQNFYRNNLVDRLIGQQADTEFYRMMFIATESREALLIAILEFIGGRDE